MYSYRIEQAIQAATVLHHTQVRKGTPPLPYVTHLFSVALIVLRYTDDEDTCIAALLHDTIEDTEYSEAELREDFGDTVTSIVLAVTEPPQETHGWEDRKKAYADQLKRAPDAALIVAAADKIHNMRSILEMYRHDYDRFLADFGGSLDARIMAYQHISNVINKNLDNDIVGEFNRVYTSYKDFILDVKEKTSKHT